MITPPTTSKICVVVHSRYDYLNIAGNYPAEGNAINHFARIIALGRIAEWWEFKVVPAMAAAYLTALAIGVSVWTIIPDLGLLIAALIPGAVFVSVLNDLADKTEDAVAGKTNRQAGTGICLPVILIGLSLLAGSFFVWVWRENIYPQSVYIFAWLAYALYSIAPFRLKERGLAGVLCDAIGANVVPAMLGAMIVAQAAQIELAPYWLPSMGGWALAFGLRGILWHQIGDFAYDEKSGTRTFVARAGIERSMQWARWVIFPVEIICITVLIATSNWSAAAFAMLALIAYIHFVRARLDQFEMQIGLVKPRPRGIMLMQEYYDVFLPIALLLAASVLDVRALGVLILHGLLFPIRWRQLLADAIRLRDPQYESRAKAD